MIDLADAVWRKSTRSNAGGDCVEVANVPGLVGVRDSKDSTGPVLVFGPDAWLAFVYGVKAGRPQR